MKNIFLNQVKIQDAPAKLDFLILTDVHNENVDKILQSIQGIRPDAYLIIGDLFESPPRRNYTKDEEAIRLLLTLQENAPVFISIGNHDLSPSIPMKAVFEKPNITVLNDDFVEFMGIKLGGFTSQTYQKKKNIDFPLRFSQETGYKILLSHHPEYYLKIRDLPIDLILSGHAHGGMWEIFGHGIFSPGQGIFPKYTNGVYEDRLIVSRGLKTSGLIKRFHNPPEIIHLLLEK